MNNEEKDYFVHESSYVDDGAKIGKKTRIWHFSHISKGAEIGEGCNLGQNVFVGNDVKIGNHVKIQNNVSVKWSGPILQDGWYAAFELSVRTPRCEYPRNTSADYKKTLVGRGASIGANATIVCGTTLGKNAFVGAGSTVTKDVPDYAMVYGNPARIHGYMCACGDTTVPADAVELKCPRCGIDMQLKK